MNVALNAFFVCLSSVETATFVSFGVKSRNCQIGLEALTAVSRHLAAVDDETEKKTESAVVARISLCAFSSHVNTA